MAFFSRKPRAFTLIELLIVVAIIAILAAIAVPNFLEAQVRAKVARTKNDMRTIFTGLEAYRVDNNHVPYMNSSARSISPPGNPRYETLGRLTTPIAYLNGRTTFFDPFQAKGVFETRNFTTRMEAQLPDPPSLKEYFYTARNHSENLQWSSDIGTGKKVQWYLLESSGPDLMKYYMGDILNSMTTGGPADQAFIARAMYDPTNGTVSEGSIWRIGGSPLGRGSAIAGVIAGTNR